MRDRRVEVKYLGRTVIVSRVCLFSVFLIILGSERSRFAGSLSTALLAFYNVPTGPSSFVRCLSPIASRPLSLCCHINMAEVVQSAAGSLLQCVCVDSALADKTAAAAKSF